eukprot:6689207-Pyramimonas_sp.AAC.1
MGSCCAFRSALLGVIVAHREVAVPGAISYVLGWGSSGILGIAVVHLPNVDAGIGLYRHRLIRLQSTPLSASLAANLILGDFNFAFSGEGRFHVQSGTFALGGA